MVPSASEHLGARHGVAKGIEIEEAPDDLLVTINLDDLGLLRPRMTVTDHEVTVGQFLHSGDPGQLDTGQFPL